MKNMTILALILIFLIGCTEKKEPVVELLKISPGPPQHYDVGDQILKKKLPEDVADGFLAFNKAPGFSYGLMMAHKEISQRSHDRSDMLMYIHSGRARFHVGDQSYYVGPGDVVYVPRGAVYSATSAQENSPLQYFTVFSPIFDSDDIIYHDKETDDQAGSDD
jgi:mannose-6-phosphate isomerase-like protein (cupin superfamily)